MARRNSRVGRRTVHWRRALLVATFCMMLLAGCELPGLPPLTWRSSGQSQQGPAPLPDAQQVAHVAVQGANPIVTLDPVRLGDTRSASAYILPLLYSGLLTLDANQRIVPALATSYAVSADGLIYTFHLRANARFADDTPITAAAVAFSLNRTMSPCGVYGAFVFSTVKDQQRFAAQSCANPQADPLTVTAQSGQPLLATLIGDALLPTDQHTLSIVLARPDGALPAKLAEPYSAVIEPSVVARYRGAWTQHLADYGGQGTSGMYAVSLQSQPSGADTLLTLTRAQGYWGATPRLRELLVDVAPQRGQVQATGEIMLAAGMAPDSPQLATSGGLAPSVAPSIHLAPARAESYLLLDPTAPGLSALQLRQALALALNKTALAALSGGVASDHLIPQHTGDYPSAPSGPVATAPLSGDTARAQGLWLSYVQSHCQGVASRCPTITLWYAIYDLIGADPFQRAFDQAVARQWQTVLPGIQVKLVGVGGGLLTPLPFVGQTSYFNWVEDYPDPQDWLEMFASEPGFSTPLAHETQSDMLVAQAEATPNPTARLALYQQAENTLLNDAIVIPIAQEQDAWAAAPTVVNFPASPAPWIPPSVWARIYLSAPASA